MELYYEITLIILNWKSTKLIAIITWNALTISNYILLVSIRTLKCEVKWIGNRLIKSLKLRDWSSIKEDNLERVGHFLLRITDDGEMVTVGDLVQSWPHFIILCISKDFLLVAVAWDIPRSSFRLFLSQWGQN